MLDIRDLSPIHSESSKKVVTCIEGEDVHAGMEVEVQEDWGVWKPNQRSRRIHILPRNKQRETVF